MCYFVLVFATRNITNMFWASCDKTPLGQDLLRQNMKKIWMGGWFKKNVIFKNTLFFRNNIFFYFTNYTMTKCLIEFTPIRNISAGQSKVGLGFLVKLWISIHICLNSVAWKSLQNYPYFTSWVTSDTMLCQCNNFLLHLLFENRRLESGIKLELWTHLCIRRSIDTCAMY